MGNLKDAYPKTRLIHMTVPLTTIQTGPKAWIKKVIGRPIGGYFDNMKRNEFNDMLRKEYGGKEPIFDLANIESTYPSWKQESFTKDGLIYCAMVPQYTQDGGHLNEKGRKIVGQELLVLLAKLSEKSK
jgi:hypothetical protein